MDGAGPCAFQNQKDKSKATPELEAGKPEKSKEQKKNDRSAQNSGDA